MRSAGRRRPLVGTIAVTVVTVTVLAAACSSGSTSGGSGGAGVTSPAAAGGGTATGAGAVTVGAGNGYVPAAEWKARQDDYLAFATKDGLAKGSFNSIMANAERARRDPGYRVDLTAAKPADFEKLWTKLETFQDTSDFDINGMLFTYTNYRDGLDPSLVAKLEEQFLKFKYWWTEPTPPGIVDSHYYWTENHQIIYLADELIAGQSFPDKTFTNSGMTGQQHVDHAKPILQRWFDLRARFGWSEWLSNVYYMEDFEGLLLIAEQSADKELATKASMAIDLLLFEIAAHTQNGAFGATHGRSYMKDKMTALDEDNFTLSKLLFDDTTFPYQHVDTATLLAIAHRYVPPEVVRKVATSTEVSVDRTHASLPMDGTAPVTPNPSPPYGLSYTDPENLMVWWGIGAQFSWPIVPLSVATIKKYDLWETENFQQAADLRPIVESSTDEQLQSLSQSLGKQLNPGLLSSVDTYTWRSPEAMLSTAQDWRPGQRGEQDHIWQATIDANAQVFAQHPSVAVPDGSDWYTNSGYWTGDGAMPRSAQFENVNISIYHPGYQSASTGPLKALGYQSFTHAYFPQDAFDEVVQKPAADGQGGWTIGRKGDGYIALYSWQPTRWVSYDGVTHPTRGMTKPFELIADGGKGFTGGPNNVWMVEVGRAADWQARAKGGASAFDTFVTAISAAPVAVDAQCTDTGGAPAPAADCGQPTGFAVRYESPTQGLVSFGSTGAFQVKSTDVALHDYPRYDNPWAKVDFTAKRYHLVAGGSSLDLDFDAGTRSATTS